MRPVFINGRFLTQKMTGVERYAAELVKAVDEHLQKGVVPERLLGRRWVLLHPRETRLCLKLSSIEQQCVGRGGGHAWEQTGLAVAARQGVLVSLANSGPVFQHRHLAVLHDAQIYRLPENFSRSYRLLHRTLDRCLAARARIGTVSQFSRTELSAFLRLAEQDIFLIPNGADHIGQATPDSRIVEKLELVAGQYFLFVGTSNRNKNLDTLLRAHDGPAFVRHPVVVVGSGNAGVFGRSGVSSRPGVVNAGRVSDAELAALYGHAAALVFPSLYEGFGIPPLEAMIFGCPVIASRTQAVVEVCGDAATYFDPTDHHALAAAMADRIARGSLNAAERQSQRSRLERFTWSRAASSLLDAIAATIEERP